MHHAPERLQSIDAVFATSCSGDRLASVVGRPAPTEDLLGDGLQLQGGALVDLADLGVAVELLDRIP